MANKKNLRYAKDNSKTSSKNSPKNYSKEKMGFKWSKLLLIPICLALLAVLVLVIMMFVSELVPQKYILAGGGTLAGVMLLAFIFYLIKNNKTRAISAVMSILVLAISSFGIFGIYTATKTLDSIGNATYKIDNMVVVVDSADTAETIYDTVDYTFGYQTTVDTENTEIMVEEIETLLGQSINLVEYDSIIALGQALLDNEVHAIIYNEAFDAIIGENVEDFTDNVRILYEHGITVEIAQQVTENSESEDETVSTSDSDEVNSINIYISGIDTYGSISKTSRSDVNIIMTINLDTKEILLTTTPRDTYLYLEGVSTTTKDKLAHAGIYGVDTSIATLETFYDIEIDYYARVNFSSLIEIVDAIGGIEVYSEYSFSTDNYRFSQGYNTMTGAQALEFSRERYSFSDGDFQRGENQQAVIEGIINKILEPSVLLQLTDIIASVSDSVETSMTSSEMAAIINMQISDGGSWSIESQSLTGTTGTSYCYSLGSNASVVYGDEDVVAEISAKINEVMTNTVD